MYSNYLPQSRNNHDDIVTWTDNYDTLLLSEISYHKIDFRILNVNDWKSIILSQNTQKYRHKDLTLSIFTTSQLTLN